MNEHFADSVLVQSSYHIPNVLTRTRSLILTKDRKMISEGKTINSHDSILV